MRTTRVYGAVFAILLVVAASGSPATAQTSGLSCSQCPGGNLPAWNCPVQEEIQISSGCLGFNNCQTPETAPQGVEIVQTGTTPSGGGIFEARLSVEVKARWNSEADIGPNGKLDMWWRSGGTATHPTSDLCEHNTTDRVYTQLRFGALSCDGAPYSLGTYSMRAVVCGGSSCQRISDESGLSVEVTKEMLGCPDPPKESCNGDAACTTCLAGGTGAGGVPPGFGGSGWPFTGPGATLRYTSGGVGHPGYPGTMDWTPALGRYWSHDYAMRIVLDPDEEHVWLLTEHGTFREWSTTGPGGVYQTVSPSNEYRPLTFLGIGNGWELAELDGTVHTFGPTGLWESTVDRNLNETIAIYDGSQLESVIFPDERREDLFYDAGGKLQTIDEVGVDGVTTRSWTYTWTGDDLSRIDRPDGTALLFHYADPSFPGSMTRVELEGDDDSSIRVLRAWEYDAEGNVSATWMGDASKTGPDAVDLWIFAYDDPTLPTVTTATDPLDDAVVYQLGRDTVSSNVRVTSISGDCPTCGLGPNTQLFYDDPNHPMLPTRTVDGRGFTTTMSYDAFGQVVSRTEAMGETEVERTTSWEYDPAYPALVTQIERPSVAGGGMFRTTDLTRDGSGNVTTRQISGVESGSAFSHPTVTTYNAAGQPRTIDPDGHGSADVTTWTYDPARGSLVADSRTDPLIGTTTFGHDAFNRMTSETDPNGVEQTTAYDELDRLTEVRVKGASSPTDDLVTTYEYNVFGDLFRTTLPEGNVIEYGYDAAGRLGSVARKPDAATPGERIFYTLDKAGNRSSEKLERWDAVSSAWVTTSETTFELSTRCQLDRMIEAPGTPSEAVTEYDYDCNGNLSALWDANQDAATDPPTKSYIYDALDRLETMTEPWAPAGGSVGTAVTTYGYDVQDHLTSVTDPEGNVTSFTFSDRDLLTEEVSPVSGTTTHGYDEHGELVSTTEARGITVTRTIDAFDRVTFLDYPDDALDTTYTYDTAPVACAASFPVGRLGSITRNGASVDYCYDRFGRLTRDGELLLSYDGNGNRTDITYPGGLIASYEFDFADREATLSVTTAGGVEGVVTAASYLPGGPLSTLVLGSGSTETHAYDRRYVPTAIGISGDPGGVGDRTWTYTTDRVGNVLSIVEEATCTGGNVLLENQTVTTMETFTSCADLEAGNGFAIESPGDVRFEAAGRIVLSDGFSVGSGASFVAAPGEDTGALSERTYSYQAPQYFLTAADGPWGTLDWSYDRIGNRLSESRNGGSPDTYVYLTNGTGNTPVLDQVTLGVGGVRDYTWGAAGHLEEVDAAGNVIDFVTDTAGRLAGISRAMASESSSFTYDGRSYLITASASMGGTSLTNPLYESVGVVHGLRRKDAPASAEELVVFFYLSGRPVAQVAIDGSTETWIYLSTDHLGTPMLATDEFGGITWEGGFEPFGTDYQAGLASGALENGIYLRLPGQWEEETWKEASSGAGSYYNLHRWYSYGLGEYTKPDPLPGRSAAQAYDYAVSNPLRYYDPSGLFSIDPNCNDPLKGCNVHPNYQDGLDQLRKEVSFACRQLSKIADDDLRKCLDESCKNGTIECNGKGCAGTTRQANNVSKCWQKNHDAILCVDNWPQAQIPPGAMGRLVFHEWSHGCGRERYTPHDPLWDPFVDPGRVGEDSPNCWPIPWRLPKFF